jgi:hypothetical protein
MRRWQLGKSRKHDACMKLLGYATPSELSRDVAPIRSCEPLPILTITDMQIERVGEPRATAKPGAYSAKVAVGLHVCGDGAVRLPELLAALQELAGLGPLDFAEQARAAILVASSQASLVGGSIAGALTAGYTNAAVASSKRITVADVNKLFLLSAFDCYAAGLNNVARMLERTPYSGTHGPRICTGFTPPGLLAHNYGSDRRQHGNCWISTECANAMALRFAKKQWLVFDDPSRKRKLGANEGPPKVYAQAPVPCRGIPHGFIPGVHSATAKFCDFVESYRKASGREDRDTVDSIFCLPFSPFTQALRPDIEASSDASLRTCFRDEFESSVATGRAHLVDSTSEEMAIVREPLFRRPCQVSAGDCPFATAYESVDSFFNAACALALVASCALKSKSPGASPAECVSHLHVVVSGFVRGPRAPDSMYPARLEVGRLALHEAVAGGPPMVQRLLAKRKPAAPQLGDVRATGAQLSAARAFWAAFARADPEQCAWTSGLAPLLTLILTHNGSHAVSLEVAAQFKGCIDAATRAAWLVHSPDGRARPPPGSPLADVEEPSKLSRQHVDPVFCGSVADGVQQRAALVGLKPHTFRQVLAEMMGSFIAGVDCNVAINEGGLSLRLSSDPTILDSDGKQRTEKSISPVQTEGDQSAFGTREDKIEGARRQKEAYDTNAMLLLPLFTSIDPPRSASALARGEYGRAQRLQQRSSALTENEQPCLEQELQAKALLFRSSDPAAAARAVLGV